MGLKDTLNRRITARLNLKPFKSKLKAPVASITFDDFPRSAWTIGGEILMGRGVRGTYYVAGGLCGQINSGLEYYSDADLGEVVAAGHEIGCHTFSHQWGQTVKSKLLLDDVERNAVFVQDLIGDYELSSFAYPYGEASPRTKALFAKQFPTSRGIRRGVNSGIMDLSQLSAFGLERSWWAPKLVENAVEQAKRQNGWLIFFTHDISEDPSPYGATPAMLNHALDALHAAEIETLPVKHALARAAFS